MRVLVVGAGAAGTMTSWRLALAGCEVTLLEQYSLDHDRGSSYGESRIVRRVYPDSLYTSLMGEAFDLWAELEEAARDASSEPLIEQRGGLFYGEAGSVHVAQAEAALRANGAEFDKLSGIEMMNRYPHFTVAPDAEAILDRSMGFARASAAVSAAAALAIDAGTIFVDDCRVTDLQERDGEIHVTTSDGRTFEGDRAVITAGPWSADFLPELSPHLSVTRQTYIHLAPQDGRTYATDEFPAWIDADANMYGFPHIRVQGVKIASHDHGTPLSDATHVDRNSIEPDVAKILDYAARRLPGLSQEVVYSKTCLYSNTPNEDFLIDAHPHIASVYLISACSGHGFKFAPLVGQIGAELAMGKAAARDLARFSIKRFLPDAG